MRAGGPIDEQRRRRARASKRARSDVFSRWARLVLSRCSVRDVPGDPRTHSPPRADGRTRTATVGSVPACRLAGTLHELEEGRPPPWTLFSRRARSKRRRAYSGVDEVPAGSERSESPSLRPSVRSQAGLTNLMRPSVANFTESRVIGSDHSCCRRQGGRGVGDAGLPEGARRGARSNHAGGSRSCGREPPTGFAALGANSDIGPRVGA